MIKNKLLVLLTFLLVFFLPTNLFFKLQEQTAYHQGIFIDYLIPKVYLTDLITVAIFLTYLISNSNKLRLNQKNKLAKLKEFFCRQWVEYKTIIILGLLILLRQFFTPYPLAATWFFCKILEMLGLLVVLRKTSAKIEKSKLHTQIFQLVLLSSLLFQTILATWQFMYQKPLFGYLPLGESRLNQVNNIAKTVWINGEERILSYGSTAHPNILAGTAVIFLYLIWMWSNQQQTNWLKKAPKLLAVPASIAVIFFTQSVSGLLSLCLLGLSFFVKTKVLATTKKLILIAVFSLFIFPIATEIFAQKFTSSFSIARRARLLKQASEMFKKNLIFGVGLNQFTVYLPTYLPANQNNLFIQPVHNAVWLVLTETGLLGLVFIILILKRGIKNLNSQSLIPILILLPIILNDHYILTNQVGILAVILLLATKQTN